MAGRSSYRKRGGESFQDVVRTYASNSELFEPAERLVRELYLCPELKDKPDDFLAALLLMVHVARQKAKSSKPAMQKPGKRWLKEAARALDDLQLASRDWICENVWELSRPLSRTKSQEYDSSAGTKDIRYTAEDRARGHADILTCDITQEEEDRILTITPSESMAMEVEPDPSILESPRKSPPRPASTVHVVEKKREAESSSHRPRDSSSSQHRNYSSILEEATSKPRPASGSRRAFSNSAERPDKFVPDSGSRRTRSTERPGKQSEPSGSRRIAENSTERPGRKPSSSSSQPKPKTVVSKVTSSGTVTATSVPVPKITVPGACSSGSVESRPESAGHTVKDAGVRRVTFGRSTTVSLPDSEPADMQITLLKRKSSEVSSERGSGCKRSRQRTCWIPECRLDNQYQKIHCYLHHVPGIFQETLPADDLQILRGRLRALRTAATWLFSEPATLQRLMDFISSQNVLAATDNSSVNDTQERAMIEFCKYNQWPIPRPFVLYPANSLAVLLHWKVVLLLAACLEEKEREDWKRLFPNPSPCEEKDQPEVLVFPEAFDSHFHLDRTLKKCQLPACGTLNDILAAVPVTEGEKVRLVGAVTVFCDPKTYPSGKHLADLPEDMKVAVGYHPKHSHYSQRSTDDYIKSLKSLLQHPRVVAFGEMGLDHQDDRKFWPAQMDLLEKLLPLLESRHVLVLHCRGIDGDCGTEAYLLLLHLLKKYVDPHHPIHVHCFTGNQYVLQRWLEVFPRSFFGFTNMVRNFNEEQIRALCSIADDRLLLESDAPYFPAGDSRWSSPGQLYAVAREVAKHRRTSAESILEITITNARHLYETK